MAQHKTKSLSCATLVRMLSLFNYHLVKNTFGLIFNDTQPQSCQLL